MGWIENARTRTGRPARQGRGDIAAVHRLQPLEPRVLFSGVPTPAGAVAHAPAHVALAALPASTRPAVTPSPTPIASGSVVDGWVISFPSNVTLQDAGVVSGTLRIVETVGLNGKGADVTFVKVSPTAAPHVDLTAATVTNASGAAAGGVQFLLADTFLGPTPVRFAGGASVFPAATGGFTSVTSTADTVSYLGGSLAAGGVAHLSGHLVINASPSADRSPQVFDLDQVLTPPAVQPVDDGILQVTLNGSILNDGDNPMIALRAGSSVPITFTNTGNGPLTLDGSIPFSTDASFGSLVEVDPSATGFGFGNLLPKLGQVFTAPADVLVGGKKVGSILLVLTGTLATPDEIVGSPSPDNPNPINLTLSFADPANPSKPAVLPPGASVSFFLLGEVAGTGGGSGTPARKHRPRVHFTFVVQ